MRSGLAVVGALAGCTFGAPVGSSGTIDGGPDAPPDACVTFSAQTDTCALPSGSPLQLAGELEFDTLTGMLHDPVTGVQVQVTTRTLTTLGDPVEAILATTVTFAPGTVLRAIGPRGLAIVATGAITLETGARIDVTAGGAGARTSCDNGPTSGGNDGGGAGGGGGGGFAAAGGAGGDANADRIGPDIPGGEAGLPVGSPPLGPRGGCPGANGGNGAEAGGLAGQGGGGVWLASAVRIELAASSGINAGGGGGRGGTQTNTQGDAGGGGGGSGGVIWLEAPQIRNAGTLAANGGGGGEASGDADPGNPGTTGMLDVIRAPGGRQSSPTGTDGGDGGHRDGPAGVSVTGVQNGGGGGGGGSVGFIRAVSPDGVLGVMSPTAP